MTENKNKGGSGSREIDPNLKYKYLGFEVKPGKIGALFNNDAEKDSWIKRIQEKRKAGARIREECSLHEPRIASYERVVLTVTSLLIVFSLFLPWFSGYKEIKIEVSPGTQQEAASGVQAGQKDAEGFASISAVKKRQEIRRENYSVSALGALISIGNLGGKVFSSGFILMLTGFLFIVYMLLCVALAAYTIYSIYTLKGEPDAIALKLKKVLRYSWIPIGIWVFCLIISVIGADYSFNATDSLVQLGSSYGISTYLGVLSYGFYLSLAALILNAVKAVEI
jgi:hypothetical protein